MQRVLIISSYAPPADGIATHAGDLATAFVSRGAEVLVLAPGSVRPRSLHLLERPQPGVHLARSLGIIRLRTTRRLVAQFAPDLVYLQFAIPALTTTVPAALALCRVLRGHIPVVAGLHEPARELALLGPLGRLVYRVVDASVTAAVTFSTAGTAALEAGRFFTSARQSAEPRLIQTALGNGPHDPPLPHAVDQLVRRWAITQPLVLSLGFTHPEKGTDLLLEAAAQLLDRPIQFMVAGSPRHRRGLFRVFGRADHAYQASLEAFAAAHRLENVTFRPYVSQEDLAPLLAAAAVVVLPYKNTTQSAIAALATTHHCAIVASDIPGLRGSLAAAATYFTPGDPVSLADTLRTLLADPHHLATLRTAAGDLAATQTFSATCDAIERAAGLS